MKKLLFLLALTTTVVTLKAQTNITSDTRQVCYWVAGDSKFSDCGTVESFESLFTLNKDETMFVHTTKNMKSSYYVKNRTYNSETGLYTYDVVSDVGNKYKFISGPPAVNFIILSTGHDNDKDDYIMKFPIKRKWSE